MVIHNHLTMEFTPKKQLPPTYKTSSALRHNPYASGGLSYLRKYKKRTRNLSAPPPSCSPRPKTSPKCLFSRTETLIKNSTLATSSKGGGGRSSWKLSGGSSQVTKRPFSAVNGVEVLKEPSETKPDSGEGKRKVVKEHDPFNIFSDGDSEVFEPAGSKSFCDKENSLFSPHRHSPKVYSNKKRIGPRSRCLGEKSPDAGPEGSDAQGCVRDEKDSVGVFSDSDHESCERQGKISSGKENSTFSTPTIVQLSTGSPSQRKRPQSLARPRLLQDISPEKVEKAYGVKFSLKAEKENVPTQSTDVQEVTLPHLIGFPNYGNTCYLNSVVQALLGLPPFVSDYQVLLSQLSVSSTSLSHGLSQLLAARTKGQVLAVKKALRVVKENLVRVDGSFSGYKMQDANEFLTRVLDTTKDEIDQCHTTIPNPEQQQVTQSHLPSHQPDVNVRNRLLEIFEDTKKKDSQNKDTAVFPQPWASSDGKKSLHISGRETMFIISDDDDDDKSRAATPALLNTLSAFPEEPLLRNPVKDNFEFQLHESYRCLGCGEMEGRKQEYFGLYVNLPEEGQEAIQDAVAAYMGADDRELKCSKCGHNQSTVVTSLTRLPRILIVQLKRYEYKTELGESLKRSSRVHINRWLMMDDHMMGNVAPPPPWDSQATLSVIPRTLKPSTLTVRNLSSELNVCEGAKEEDEVPDLNEHPKPSVSTISTCTSTATTSTTATTPSTISANDKEEEELQEVMRRSMEDVGGNTTREEDEIQQAIRLSLQDLGMSYTHENQGEGQEDEKHPNDSAESKQDLQKCNHVYRLISIISHFGLTTNTGHYVADVYNTDDDNWYHYDDECVSRIPESVVFAEGRQKNGYIFFYIHKDLLQNVGNKSGAQR